MVSQSVKDYAKLTGVKIVREGEIDADELAELVDRSLRITADYQQTIIHSVNEQKQNLNNTFHN